MRRRWWMLMIFPCGPVRRPRGVSRRSRGRSRRAPIAVYDLPVTRAVTDYEEFPGETNAIIRCRSRRGSRAT